jgi:hypothetical protein
MTNRLKISENLNLERDKGSNAKGMLGKKVLMK